MKLKQIKTIKGYKSFQNFSWQPFLNNEVFHDNVNIFYGENGSGKSSICNILKNVLPGGGITEVISDNKHGYKSFGKIRPGLVSLQFDDGEYNFEHDIPEETDESAVLQYVARGFSDNFWDKKLPASNSILFFDRDFVAKNVHEYERKTTKGGQEQESGKLIIEFDSKAIEFRNIKSKAKDLKDQHIQVITKFTDSNKEVMSFDLSSDDKVLFSKYCNFSETEIKGAIDKLLEEQDALSVSLKDDKHAFDKVVKIQNEIRLLTAIDEDLTLAEYEKYQGLFDFDLKESTQVKAKQTLVEKITNHKAFFESGVALRELHKGECPFCQSKTEEDNVNLIVDLYNQIFDTTYKAQFEKFETDKSKAIRQLDKILDFVINLDLTTIFLELRQLAEDYKIPQIYLISDEKSFSKPELNQIKVFREQVSSLERPNKQNIKESYQNALENFKAIKEFFKSLNDFIERKNQKIQEFKNENTNIKIDERIKNSELRLSEILNELVFLQNNKIQKQKQKLALEKELEVLNISLKEFDNSYKEKLEQYEGYCSSKAFTDLLGKIQDYFENFNFNFTLKLKDNRTGNKNEFPFAFWVLDSEGNERDFKEGLSEGEIQVLSLCFFFAFIEIQEDKKSKILVFDDPITSLDNSNLSCLVDLIAKEKNKFSQTFIFAHHRTFFKFLRNRFGSNCNEYNIVRNKKEFGGSFICKSKNDKFILKLRDFDTHLKNLPPDSFDMELKIVEYGQYLRYEVERFIKNELLHWNAAQDFSLAIAGIKNNKTISDDDLDTVSSVYSFCNWTTSHVDVGDDHGLSQLRQKIESFITVLDNQTI